MKVIVLDTETKVTRLEDRIDGSAFAAGNRIVSAHWKLVDLDNLQDRPVCHSVYHHREKQIPDGPQDFQAALNSADMLVAHNAKYDIEYLLESGFTIPPLVWCTMVGEYVLARGTIVPLSLKETALRRKVRLKKDDLTHELFKSGTGYEDMPLPIVLEYGDGDVDTCGDIFLQQWTEFQDVTKTRKLKNIITLMNEMLLFLVEIERNGVAIDLESLELVRIEYEAERSHLLERLIQITEEVMGDIPINLNSGADISKIIYSREVIDRKLHMETFNVGLDQHGKKQFPPYMTPNQFRLAVSTTTKRVEKKSAHNCPMCNGNKFVRKMRKDGTPFKNETKCKECDGRGFILQGMGKVAGFKLRPESPRDASVHGFAAGGDNIDRLIDQAQKADNLLAVEFLTKKKRLNAINTYLNSFVEGIQRWTRSDGLLHPTFNQCVARTGRLSSSDPNFQNQPKGRKFPVRKSIVSRWKDTGGLILEADFSGLEFVVAGELSRDKQIIEDITTGKDIHRQTGSIIHQKDKSLITKDERNAVKPYTFAPLYGGQGANEPEHIRAYFKEFFVIYAGHEEWQFNQMDNVIKYGYIATPSGREYTFPGTRRLKGRKTTNATNIVNYPVQGFATGDIVPLACVRAYRKFMELGLRSLLILTVHDSIVVDVYPNEVEQVKAALRWAMTEADQEIKDRWGYEMVLKLKCEIAVGPNWMEMEEVK